VTGRIPTARAGYTESMSRAERHERAPLLDRLDTFHMKLGTFRVVA